MSNTNNKTVTTSADSSAGKQLPAAGAPGGPAGAPGGPAGATGGPAGAPGGPGAQSELSKWMMDKSGFLPNWAWIVVGILIFLIICSILYYFLVIRKKSKNSNSYTIDPFGGVPPLTPSPVASVHSYQSKHSSNAQKSSGAPSPL